MNNDKTILIQIGQKLRRARLNADIGQDELAAHTGLSRKTIQNAESGSNYSMETLIRLLRGLNSLHYLEPFLTALSLSEIDHLTMDAKQQQRQRASGRCPDPEDDRSVLNVENRWRVRGLGQIKVE